jgi:hypothetical protein
MQQLVFCLYLLAVPYGGRQDARLEPKYIHKVGYIEPQALVLVCGVDGIKRSARHSRGW